MAARPIASSAIGRATLCTHPAPVGIMDRNRPSRHPRHHPDPRELLLAWIMLRLRAVPHEGPHERKDMSDSESAIRVPATDRAAVPARAERARRDPDPIRRELFSLRARVRALAEDRARLSADRLTDELRVLSQETARAMSRACESRQVLARLHRRLTRQVNAELRRAPEDDQTSIELRARAVVLTQLDAILETPKSPRRQSGNGYAHADLTPGAVEALRLVEQHRDTVRSRFQELKCRLQTELAELSLEMATETAARLCLKYSTQRSEWLCWRLARTVDELVAISRPPTLPASLEALATRSVLAAVAERNTELSGERQGRKLS